MDELIKLCKPLVDYLAQNYNQHTEIIVSVDAVIVKQNVLGIPLKDSD